jgi:hypothetical protein
MSSTIATKIFCTLMITMCMTTFGIFKTRWKYPKIYKVLNGLGILQLVVFIALYFYLIWGLQYV